MNMFVIVSSAWLHREPMLKLKACQRKEYNKSGRERMVSVGSRGLRAMGRALV